MRHQFIILADGPDALIEFCGISLLERLLRTVQRLGLTKAIILSATPDVLASHLEEPSPHCARVAIDLRHRAPGSLSVRQIAEAWPNEAGHVIVIRGDSVFDSRLIELLDDQNTTAALVDSAPPPSLQPLVALSPNTSRGRLCGAGLISRDWVKSHDGLFDQAWRAEIEIGEIEALDIAGRDWHHRSMRLQQHPIWFPGPAPAQKQIARRVLIQAAQKGSLDFPAMVHGPIENFIISHLCRTPITPNQLTAMTNIAAWGATFLLATGRLGWGAILALAVGVLDGLDGKLARVKIETTKAGKLEHWFDTFFEHSWWIAIAYYLQSSGRLPGAFFYLLLLMGAEAVAGLAKFSVIRSCGRTLDELGEFNRIVRLIGGRRNIYVWVFALGVLLGAPAEAFKIMSIWAAITAVVQVPRAAFAFRAHRERRASLEFPAEA